ncbi:endolytic transglycosylase MltG [Shimia ponticola]|uniref:endolytic transglycosylase MltG n=1 Tax=Shimia ponticola TaxID=2582893 RepID=UPI0011BE31C9|nr:endolytic transglycosylase MltG [Shimia ponticola]
MWRHIASNALSFFVVGLFLIGGLILWGMGQYEAEGPLSRAICLKVDPGSNMTRVASKLESEGAISNKAIFRLAADYTEQADDLKAGSFLIEPGATMQDILTTVTVGGQSTCGTEVVYRIGVNRTSVQVRDLDPETSRYVEQAVFDPAADEAPAEYEAAKESTGTRFRVAVAEGVTSWQIITSLRSLDILQGAVDEIPPEGSLAPDSYEVTPGTERSAIVARMLAAQETRLADAWAAREDGLPYDNPAEALIMASIIEKETGVADERRQVASVFVNRLNRGMRLQTDPTVIYGITRGQGVLGRGLRQSELRGETPWNTYVIDGLPPTPIANPGAASIEAALNPDETPYIFFVADGTGGHAFAETLEEHNRNVARWRQIEAERANQ